MVHIYLRVHVGDFLLKPANPFFIRDLLVSVPLNECLFGLFDLIRALFEPLVLLLGVEQFGQPYEQVFKPSLILFRMELISFASFLFKFCEYFATKVMVFLLQKLYNMYLAYSISAHFYVFV